LEDSGGAVQQELVGFIQAGNRHPQLPDVAKLPCQQHLLPFWGSSQADDPGVFGIGVTDYQVGFYQPFDEIGDGGFAHLLGCSEIRNRDRSGEDNHR